MRSTCRLFMAAILFIAVAGFARAQDSASPPPVAPDAVVSPPAELPVIPFANPEPPPVEPALTIDQSALAVEPVAPATVEPVAAPTAEKAAVTTTTKRVAKKTSKKPAEKPAVEVGESLKPGAAAASVAVTDTTSNPPPPNAAASVAQAKSTEPLAPAAGPAVKPLTEETTSSRTMGVGGWLLGGLAVAALFIGITFLRRRKTRKPTSIVQLADLSMDLEPVPVTRP
jgi:hypothetical protein